MPRVNGSRAQRTAQHDESDVSVCRGRVHGHRAGLEGHRLLHRGGCSSGAVEPSHVLTAIGLAPEDARATLRLSLGHQTTDEEIDFALDTIPPVIERLRQLSPTYKKPAIA